MDQAKHPPVFLLFHFPDISDAAFDEIASGKYMPFFSLLEEHPQIKCAMRLNGAVLEKLKTLHQDLLDKLSSLVKSRQVEMLCGAWFDPSFHLVPDQDIVAQIAHENEFIKREFRAIPRGYLHASRNFDPRLIKYLADLGLDYIVIPEEVLLASGAKPQSGYFVTEEQGKVIRVFSETPILEALVPEAGPGAATHFSDLIDEFPSLGQVYLKATSTFDKKILFEKPSIGVLHKKTLYVSSKLDSMKRAQLIGMKDEKRERVINEASRLLWMGEADPFFLSIKPSSKTVNFLLGSLIEAENLVDSFNRRSDKYIDLINTDFDKDGEQEALVSSNIFNVYVSPKRGGTLFEIDHKPKKMVLVAEPFLLDEFISKDAAVSSGGAYRLSVDRKPSEVSLKLSKDISNLRLTKTISVFAGQSIINIYYEIENASDVQAELELRIKMPFSIEKSPQNTEVFTEGEAKIVDARRGSGVSLKLEKPAEMWSSGDTSQDVVLFPTWKIVIAPKGVWSNRISLSVE